MPKTRPKRGPSENDIKFKDEIDTKQPLSQKDRFWKLARQYMRGQMQSPWEWMNADDDTEAAQESHEDYLDYLESQTPGQGQYVGDYQVNQQGQVIPGGQAAPQSPQTPSGGSYGALGGQVTPEGLFPPGTTTEADQYTQDLISGEVTSFPQQVPYRPREELSQPAPLAGQAYNGAPPEHVRMAVAAGQKYGIDPGVLLSIAKLETQFGTAGLGKKGLTLGYGAYDNNPSFEWAGPETQYNEAARRLSEWGVKGIGDIGTSDANSKAARYATDENWQSKIQNIYKSLAPQVGTPAGTVNQIAGKTDVFTGIINGIQNGTVDPSVLDTLGPGLSNLADTTSQTADANEALAYDPATDEDEEDDE